MKIQIDTTAKTIRVEENVNLGELVKELNKLLPKSEWKKYELDATNETEFVPYYPSYPSFPITVDFPNYPSQSPIYVGDVPNFKVTFSE